MKVYVSGPMSGLPEFNYPAFRAASARLRQFGFTVECPTEIGTRAGLEPGTATWEDFMREDLRALLDCDAVVTLPGWQRSRGATLECHVAVALGLPLWSLDEALEQAA